MVCSTHTHTHTHTFIIGQRFNIRYSTYLSSSNTIVARFHEDEITFHERKRILVVTRDVEMLNEERPIAITRYENFTRSVSDERGRWGGGRKKESLYILSRRSVISRQTRERVSQSTTAFTEWKTCASAKTNISMSIRRPSANRPRGTQTALALMRRALDVDIHKSPP